MLDEECIKNLEISSNFNITNDEKKYILDKFNNMIKNCEKLIYVPKTEEVFHSNIEDEII